MTASFPVGACLTVTVAPAPLLAVALIPCSSFREFGLLAGKPILSSISVKALIFCPTLSASDQFRYLAGDPIGSAGRPRQVLPRPCNGRRPSVRG